MNIPYHQTETRKLRKEKSGNCKVDSGDVFAEGLNNSSNCDTLFNWLKEIEAKVLEIYEVANTIKEIQIKGKKRLKELKDLADQDLKRFNDYKVKKNQKKRTIKYLKERVSSLENKNGEIEQQIYRQKKHSRKNYLLKDRIKKEGL